MTGLVVLTVVLMAVAIFVALVASGSGGSGLKALVGGMVFCLALVGYNYVTTYHNDHWVVCNVTGKDRGGDDGSYRIYTSDCGQLANKDSLIRLKYDSADVWQAIPDSGPVELRIAGSRIGFLSMFPNVFEARAVDASD